MGANDNPNRPELTTYVECIKKYSNINPKVLVEAGTKDGKDSLYLSSELGISHSGIYLFEPNKMLYKKLEDDISLKNMNKSSLALFNKTCKLKFHEALNEDDGRSSILDRPEIYSKSELFKTVEIDAIRLDDFMEEKSLKTIDMFKLDVEGATMEVLLGAGERLKDIKSFQIEAEYYQIWENQTTWTDIKTFLQLHNFTHLWEIGYSKRQCDSIWIKNEYLIRNNNDQKQ